MIGGLSWNEAGNPAYCCLIQRKSQKAEDTFDLPKPYIEIVKEYEEDSLKQLLDKLIDEKTINVMYAQKGFKYNTFIRDFNIWRREHRPNMQLKPSTVSSFEAGVIKIKDMVLDKRIKFPDESIVLTQLKVFSKLSLKNEIEYYAISALTNAINAYHRQTKKEQEKVPKLSGWY